MKASLHFLILALSAVWALAETPSDPVFRDGFDETPAAPWRWAREVASDWRLKEGALELRAQKGRVWGGNDGRNLLVLDLPPAGHSASVEVDLGAPETIYEQGGLLLYLDHDNFVKLIVEHIEDEMFIVLARELDGRGNVLSKIGIPSKEARLRLSVNGMKVAAAFRIETPAGEEPVWREAGACDFPAADEAHFALFTQDGSDEDIRWIRFDDFELRRLPPADAP